MSEQQESPQPDGFSLTEEIRLLVELVVERAAPWLDGVIAAGHGKPPGEQQASGETSGGCGWCPLCAIVAVVQGERPEFAARLMEQAAQLVALLRAVLADRWEPEGGVHMPGFQPAPRPAREREEEAVGATTSARVQHITVRRRGDWQPDRES